MYLTAPEACKRLQIGREKLRVLISKGEIEAVRLGDTPQSRLRISAESLDAYIKRQTITAVS